MPAAKDFVTVPFSGLSICSFVAQVSPEVTNGVHAVYIYNGLTPIVGIDVVPGAGVDKSFKVGNVTLRGLVNTVQPIHVVISLLPSRITVRDQRAGDPSS